MAGRRPVVTPTGLEEMRRRRRNGASLTVIADSLGIPRKTLYHVVAQGEAAEACEVPRCRAPHHGPRGPVKYADVSRALREAKGQAAVRAAALVQNSFERDVRAAERFLQREYPEDYGAPATRAAPQRSGRPEAPHRCPAPLQIHLVPSDRPQEEIDALMAEIHPSSGSPARADAVDESERTTTGAAAAETGDDDEPGTGRDPGAPARPAATPPEPGPDEDDDDPDTWRDPISGRLINDINAEADRIARIHKGEEPP